MVDGNPFPDSPEKRYLRRIHLDYLSQRKQVLGRELAYFGLPSAEMADVKLWRSVLGNITAVERLPHVAEGMYRTAQQMGVRSRMVLLEGSLLDVCRMLAKPECDMGATLPALSLSEQAKAQRARGTGYDVINLDLCGGFLYPKKSGESDNVEALKLLIAFQARHSMPFLLLITFNLRDTGGDEYDSFISEVLRQIGLAGIQVSTLERYYFEAAKGQPPQLRRLRFCVPAYLHQRAHEHFAAKSIGSWYYKTFYHTALFFETRKGPTTLGMPWPPLDEFRDLLATPMLKVQSNKEGGITTVELDRPPVW